MTTNRLGRIVLSSKPFLILSNNVSLKPLFIGSLNHCNKKTLSSDAKTSPSDKDLIPKIYGVTYVPPLKITRQHTKAGDYGLYDGLKVRAGDSVSKSKQRSKRVWKPNVQKCKLWSEVLGQSLQLRVTSAALKTIDRVGGLDRYVLQMSDERLGGTGIRIRELVIAAMKEKVKLTKSFTQPIPEEQEWKIPQWQDAVERANSTIVRKMVPSLSVNRVTVYPRKLHGMTTDHLILQDMHERGQRGKRTSRRSTHPRR
ncbi:hypothetical protein O181_007331 [Austropuccinia psidii MF-1]|uniref:Large ribosomal subunit protein bL28m n=1 Tax=Austropuccinia psidii MF-1 TaxID=1389203 RepID=A0A9Q3BML6_9BASI|nr:hypothetical protein [Austropuccinia psidii MF-1]